MPVDCTKRTRPIRISVDLPPDDYSALRQFAFDASMTHAGVVRALVELLADKTVAQRVRGWTNDS